MSWFKVIGIVKTPCVRCDLRRCEYVADDGRAFCCSLCYMRDDV